jgi:hypothetical protein
MGLSLPKIARRNPGRVKQYPALGLTQSIDSPFLAVDVGETSFTAETICPYYITVFSLSPSRGVSRMSNPPLENAGSAPFSASAVQQHGNRQQSGNDPFLNRTPFFFS